MTRSVIILRGVSGSGKSSLAERLNGVVVSADIFFQRADGYRFDAAKLREAHAACLRAFVEMITTVNHFDENIIVDNTNTRLTEVAPYAALAEAFGFELLIITVHCPDEVAHARNRHGVPLEVIERQARQLHENPTPNWWKGVIVDGQAPRYDEVFRQGTAWLDADAVNYCVGCWKQIPEPELMCGVCREAQEGGR